MKDLKGFKRQLEIERENLNRLIDEALENGTSISQTPAIIKQGEKVDIIIGNIQNEIGKKNQYEQ